MPSVTRVVLQTKQPRGGYLNPKDLECVQLSINEELTDMTFESVSPDIIGTVVD